MSSPYTTEAVRLTELSSLVANDVARATGTTARTVRAWLAGTRTPSDTATERVIELVSIVERLTWLMRRDYIAVWLRKPLRELDDDKPLDLIAAGEYRRVCAAIARLEEALAR